MSRYMVVFEWAGRGHEDVKRELTADTLDMAKLQAAMLYAADFEDPGPDAYRIIENGKAEVYRYPEPTFH